MRRRNQHALALTLEDLEPRLQQGKQLGQRRGALRFAHHQVAALAQGEREELQRPPLELGSEVDQHVATQHQVDARKRRALSKVVLAEDDHAPQLLADFPGGIERGEVTLPSSWRHVLQGRARVHAASSKGDRVAIQVGGEDAHGEVIQLLADELGHQDRQ